MSEQLKTGVDIAQVVSRNPQVHSGDLVFAGTRVPVEILFAYLKGSDGFEEFLEGYPTVERQQVEALLELAPEAIDQMRARSACSA